MLIRYGHCQNIEATFNTLLGITGCLYIFPATMFNVQCWYILFSFKCSSTFEKWSIKRKIIFCYLCVGLILFFFFWLTGLFLLYHISFVFFHFSICLLEFELMYVISAFSSNLCVFTHFRHKDLQCVNEMLFTSVFDGLFIPILSNICDVVFCSLLISLWNEDLGLFFIDCRYHPRNYNLLKSKGTLYWSTLIR